jgi:hypothetical protein
VIAYLLIVQLVSFVSGFAQADTEPRLQQSSLRAVRAYVPVRHGEIDVELPTNLIVAAPYQEIVEAMRRSSPTFRQQCLRIASASNLTVFIRFEAPPRGTNARAWTDIHRADDGRITATVRIGERENATELIAHELEHIVEQLDGIDLKSKAALASTGVRRCQCGDADAFETLRAVFVGTQVAREVHPRDR